MPKGNPNPSPSTRFGAGPNDEKRNAGGRTPTAWLREILSAANDKSPDGASNRKAIALHLIEVATSWVVKIKGQGDHAVEVADAKDSIEAAKILWAYDMGKPVESIELESPKGTMSPTRKPTTAETRQELDRVMEIIGKGRPITGTEPAAETESQEGSEGETSDPQAEP